MRWKIPVVAIILLIAVYTFWPFYALYRLAAAAEAKDVAALEQSVDIRLMRQSIARQISATYLAMSGRGAQFGAASAGVGSVIADALIGELLTPEALADLLSKGYMGGAVAASDAAPLGGFGLNKFGQIWLRSDYGIGNFYVRVPPDHPSPKQFQLHLRLIQWRWKLVGIQMPEELRLRLAQEWVKRERRP